MKITLRQRQKNNKISLYLEYYEKGRREYEYLNLYSGDMEAVAQIDSRNEKGELGQLWQLECS